MYVCTVLMKGKYVCCVCWVGVVVAPNDVTKYQNWLKMRGGVVTKVGQSINSIVRMSIHGTYVASRKEFMVMYFD